MHLRNGTGLLSTPLPFWTCFIIKQEFNVQKSYFSLGDGCRTVAGQKCILPFNYEGTTYSECTSVDNDQPWCAYEVDSEGNLVEGEWENCGNTCYLGMYTVDVYRYKTIESINALGKNSTQAFS